MKPSLEQKYDTTNYYALTIQPEDKLQFLGKKPTARIMSIRQHYYSLLQEAQFPYYINLEISEPTGSLHNGTSGGRLHYHGIIKFNNNKQITSFLLEYQYKLLRQARIEISKINDKEAWLKYIHKQTLLSKDITILTNWDIKTFKDKYIQDGC